LCEQHNILEFSSFAISSVFYYVPHFSFSFHPSFFSLKYPFFSFSLSFPSRLEVFVFLKNPLLFFHWSTGLSVSFTDAVHCTVRRSVRYSSSVLLQCGLQIIAKCGCMSAFWALTDVESRRANFTSCINHTSDNEQTASQWVSGSFKNALCSLRVEDDTDACGCKLPCDEILYDVLLYVSGSWPHKSYQQAFYDTYLRETSYGDKIDKHADDTVSLSHCV